MFSSQWWKIYFWGRAYLEYNEEHKTTQSVCSEKQTCQKGTCFSSFFLNLLTVLTRIFVTFGVSPCQIERCTNLLTGKKEEEISIKIYLFNLTLMIRTVWSKGHFFRTERNISNKKSRFCHRVCGFPLEIECRNARNRTQWDKSHLKSH